MPLNIRGKSYPLPKEENQPGVTGRELIEIEEQFGLDGLTLLGVLSEDEPSKLPGYTKAKALYAVAWIALTRGGEILSVNDVLNDYSIDEFMELESDPKEQTPTNSSEVEHAEE